MLKIIEKDGDITQSKSNFICHCVNCQGKMGSGVAKALKEKYPLVFSAYNGFVQENGIGRNLLGKIQVVQVTNDDINVVNMFCQEYYGYDGRKYVSYDAIVVAFNKLCDYFLSKKTNTDMIISIPYKFGSGLAGGNWNIVKEIITQTLITYNLKQNIILEIWKKE